MSPASSHTHAGPRAVSPTRVFALVLAVVFAVELLIMGVVSAIPPAYRDDLWISLADSATLVTVLCPALWVLIVRPLRGLVADRGALLSRALEIQEEERARISRDLHDELGQAQTAVLLGLRTVLNADTVELARSRAESVHQIAGDAIESTRRIARGLSPTVLRDFGIGSAIERICEDFAAAGDVEIVRDLRIDDRRFDPAIEMSAYRIVQEAITNAVKHAAARRISVLVQLEDGLLSLRVSDDGRGLPPREEWVARAGLGLAGMRERVVLLDGVFQIETEPGAGTAVSAAIPAKTVTA